MLPQDKMKQSQIYAFLLGIAVTAFFFVIPVWPHSSKWGVYPVILVGLGLLLVLFLKFGANTTED